MFRGVQSPDGFKFPYVEINGSEISACKRARQGIFLPIEEHALVC